MTEAMNDNEEAPLEGSVFNARQVRILKIVVIVLGVLLLLGFAVVMVTIVYQASRLGKSDGATTGAAAIVDGQIGGTDRGAAGKGAAEIDIGALYAGKGQVRIVEGLMPAGAKHRATTVDGDRLFITLEDVAGLIVLQVDLAQSKVVGAVRLSRSGRK